MDFSRRSLLRLASIGASVSLTGCSAIAPTNTRSPNQSPTSPPTALPTESGPVAFSAEVLRQSTAEHPAQLRARLDNQSTETVQVGFGPTLLFTANRATDELEWTDQIVIDPETYVGPWDEPTRSSEGCWRFPEDGSRLVQSSLNWRELSPSESLTETYDVYTEGTSRPCLPEGNYRFQDNGYLGDKSQVLTFTLSVQIDTDHQLSVNTRETAASTD